MLSIQAFKALVKEHFPSRTFTIEDCSYPRSSGVQGARYSTNTLKNYRVYYEYIPAETIQGTDLNGLPYTRYWQELERWTVIFYMNNQHPLFTRNASTLQEALVACESEFESVVRDLQKDLIP